MPKIVWLDQKRVKETKVPNRGFLTVGRDATNHIILSDSRVSRLHARLICGPHGCLLKDLKSANGVQVNGDPVHTRFLQDGDIIRIGRHILEYLSEPLTKNPAPDRSGLAFRLQADIAQEPSKILQTKTTSQPNAYLRYTSGPRQGEVLSIDRPLLPIGDPAGFYVAVSKRTNGYYLLNLGHNLRPKINDDPVRGASVLLRSGDTLTMGNERLEVKIFERTEH
jgi:predicted component of type VI protein secretion system